VAPAGRGGEGLALKKTNGFKKLENSSYSSSVLPWELQEKGRKKKKNKKLNVRQQGSIDSINKTTPVLAKKEDTACAPHRRHQLKG